MCKTAYPACFFKEEQGYSAVFPDLNWLATDGSTMAEARQRAAEILSCYLQWAREDGDPIPPASKKEEIDLVAIAAELENSADGAWVEMVKTVDIAEIEPMEYRQPPEGSYIIVAGAHGVGKSSFAGALGYDPAIIHETTLDGSDPDAEARQAWEDGLSVQMSYIALEDVSEALQRVRSRVEHGGHETTPEDVQRSFEHRWEALNRVLPYCDTADFYDNENGFVKVAEYRDGAITATVENNPKWLREMLNYFSQ